MTGVRWKVTAPAVDVREVPDNEALRGKLESQLLHGEIFIAEEETAEWLKGRCEHDGYTGYVEKKYLTREFAAATHVVTAQRTDVYRDASIKSPIRATLGFGSQVTVTEMGEKFAKLDDGTHIYAAHLSDLSAREDFVAAAEKLAETPYVWGGRGGLGIDCSGLVQIALARAGINAARDTEDQEKTVGTDATDKPRQRGDIVYFPGHVGIMVDDKNILHANATHMKTCVEPLDVVTKRSDGIVTAVRRI
ncbi:MAG: NlpC/P60 family protein [Alphaproteobacteria bacterium]